MTVAPAIRLSPTTTQPAAPMTFAEKCRIASIIFVFVLILGMLPILLKLGIDWDSDVPQGPWLWVLIGWIAGNEIGRAHV